MGEDEKQRIRAIDEQIHKLRKLRERWTDGEDLSPKEKIQRGLTLELLDGALEDLLKRRRAFKRGQD
jgi:hypothetical protein